MLPNPALAKLMILILGGTIALTPIAQTQQPKQAGKITNKISKTVIDKAKDKAKQNENPNYKPKKLPIIAGYKPGKDPLPQGTTPAQTYINAWNLLKKELGLK